MSTGYLRADPIKIISQQWKDYLYEEKWDLSDQNDNLRLITDGYRYWLKQ